MLSAKLRNIVAASSCMILLGAVSPIVQAATVTAPETTYSYDIYCKLTGTTGELAYYDMIVPSSEQEDARRDIEALKASTPVVKGLLENKTTGPYTRAKLKEISDKLALVAAEVQNPNFNGFDPKYDVSVNYRVFPDGVFTAETDPTLAYSPYSYSFDDSWQDRADTVMWNLYSKARGLIYSRLILDEGKKDEIAPSTYRIFSDEKARWNDLSDDYYPVSDADPSDPQVVRDIVTACDELKKAVAASATAERTKTINFPTYTFDDFAKQLTQETVAHEQQLLELVAEIQDLEAGLAVDLQAGGAKQTQDNQVKPTAEKDPVPAKEESQPEQKNEGHTGFNWKVILIIVAILAAIGAAASVTVAPRPM